MSQDDKIAAGEILGDQIDFAVANWSSAEPAGTMPLAGCPNGDSADLDELGPALLEMVETYTQRTMAGDTVDIDELVANYPGWDGAFRSLLPTLRELATLDHAVATDEDIDGGPDPVQGKIFGDFKIVREIGRGGMGVVYEARQIALGRRVALKVLPLTAAMDPKALQRFQLEAQVAGLMQHPRIVPVHAVGTVGDVPYFAMQFIEGGSLACLIAELRGLVDRGGDRSASPTPGDSPSALALGLLTGRFAPSGRDSEIDRHQIDPDRAVPGPTAPQSIRSKAYLRTIARLGFQAAEALAHAHDQGIIHRDVKPANLLLDRHGDLWVADFGMADVQGDAGLTMTGDLPGTLRYMSPEQAAGRRALIDRRTDVYSLGATLYELLTLQPAIVGSDRVELIRRIAEDEPEPIRRLNPAVPVDLATIVSKALSKEPAKRYETALQLADDLNRYLDGRPITARPVGAVARSWRWCRRKPVQAGLAAGLFLALAVGLSGITWNWLKAQTAEKQAKAEAAKADAINRFLIDKLLGRASPNNNPRARDVTLREALDKSAAEVGQSFKDQPEIEAAIRMALGKTYHDLHDFPQSESHYRAAHEILRNQPLSSVESRIQAKSELGHLVFHANRLDEAEKLTTEAVNEARQALGPLHNLTIAALDYMGNLYKARGRLEEAEALFRTLVKDSAKSRGLHAWGTLIEMANLGVILMQRERYDEAETVLRDCLDLESRFLGLEHPDTLTMMNHLAELLRKTNRSDEAEGFYRRCLAARSRVLGPAASPTVQTAVSLATLLRARGRFIEAEAVLETTYQSQRQILGADDPDTKKTGKSLEGLRESREKAATSGKH